MKLAGDTLTMSTRPGVTYRLRPTYTVGFARGGGSVWFSRDRAGKITAMHFSEGRMWDLVLTRVR